MSRIRPIVLGVLRRDGDYLLQRLTDPGGETFYRPIGGGIEFGETSGEALEREFREELDVEVEAGPTIGTMENRFRWDGAVGHEFVVLRGATFDDASLRERFEGHDDGGVAYTATWQSLADLADAPEPLYPEGVGALLRDEAGATATGRGADLLKSPNPAALRTAVWRRNAR